MCYPKTVLLQCSKISRTRRNTHRNSCCHYLSFFIVLSVPKVTELGMIGLKLSYRCNISPKVSVPREDQWWAKGLFKDILSPDYITFGIVLHYVANLKEVTEYIGPLFLIIIVISESHIFSTLVSGWCSFQRESTRWCFKELHKNKDTIGGRWECYSFLINEHYIISLFSHRTCTPG